MVRPCLHPVGRAQLLEQYSTTLSCSAPPASLIGSELSSLLGSGPWLCPTPMPQGRLMYTRPQPPNSVHKRHDTRRYDISLLERITLSGWGYTDFHASVNFAFWAFRELPLYGVLRSSPSPRMGMYTRLSEHSHR